MPSVAAHGDDLAAFLDRLPAELLHFQQDIADAAGLVIARGGMVGELVDELFVLGADAPAIARLLAVLHRGHELIAALDQRLLPL